MMYKIYNKKHKTYKNKVTKYNMLAYTPFIYKSGLMTVYEKKISKAHWKSYTEFDSSFRSENKQCWFIFDFFNHSWQVTSLPIFKVIESNIHLNKTIKWIYQAS